MNALDHLRSLIRLRDQRQPAASTEIDEVLRALALRVRSAASMNDPVDLQQAAVRRFWQTSRIESPKEGRLLSFGLRLPVSAGGPSIIEDDSRFRALLCGVDQWLPEPRKYRRCFHGLVTSYFGYDVQARSTPIVGRENWATLRGYLADRSPRIVAAGANPDWVTCVTESPHLFTASPCEPYAMSLLRGETAAVDRVRSELHIDDSSWFVRDLLLAQVVAATREPDDIFTPMLSRLLAMVVPNTVLRDRGLILLLDRYALVSEPRLHKELRDHAVAWWGNPWLPAHKMRWGGVTVAARRMVADWLKAEFVEAFFTLLAEEGNADKRRLEFWLKYVGVMDTVEFALGADARTSRDKNFVELRKKMFGVMGELKDPISASNAFMMTIGDVVLVEFSSRSNALYGYDRARGLPFALDKPLVSTKDAPNSLKSSKRQLWLMHADGVRGWMRWEDRFAEVLQDKYQIRPDALGGAPKRESAPPRPQSYVSHRRQGSPTTGAPKAVSSLALRELAAKYGCEVEDNSRLGGNVWLRASEWNEDLDRLLKPRGFKFRPGKGWWK